MSVNVINNSEVKFFVGRSARFGVRESTFPQNEINSINGKTLINSQTLEMIESYIHDEEGRHAYKRQRKK